MAMTEQTTSPYAPPAPSKSLRIIKPDPYNYLFSKWNFIRWAFYFTAMIIILWALTDTIIWIAVMKGILALAVLIYYFKNLHNARKMDETLNIWAFRKRALFKDDLIITMSTDTEYLDEVFPLKQIILVVPGLVTLLKFKGDVYAVMWKVHTKNYDQSVIDELELKVKKWLDGLQENLVFQSVWYKVDAHNAKTLKVIGEAAESSIHTKPKDLHVQALMAYATVDNRPQNVVKHVYLQSLGRCVSIEEAISQFDAIIPGLESELKSSLHDLERVTAVTDIVAIQQEIWESEQVLEW